MNLYIFMLSLVMCERDQRHVQSATHVGIALMHNVKLSARAFGRVSENDIHYCCGEQNCLSVLGNEL